MIGNFVRIRRNHFHDFFPRIRTNSYEISMVRSDGKKLPCRSSVLLCSVRILRTLRHPWHAKYSWCRCFVLVYDVCTSNPYCGMGTCVSHGVNSYNCLCDAGYTGIVCTEEIDECSSNPCLHGNCTQFIGSYQCSCEYGYEGAECDMPAHSSCERRTIKEAFRAKIETLLINLLHFLYVFGGKLAERICISVPYVLTSRICEAQVLITPY